MIIQFESAFFSRQKTPSEHISDEHRPYSASAETYRCHRTYRLGLTVREEKVTYPNSLFAE
jgi:hypothetical protein